MEKNIKKIYKRIITVIIVILGVFNILLLSTLVTTGFKKFYYVNINILKIEEKSGFTKEEMRENYDYIIDYVLGKNEDEFQLPTMKFSEEGAFHFKEVRDLLSLAKVAILIGVIIQSILIYLYIRKYKDAIFVKYTSMTLLCLPILVGIVSINFNYYFTLFHEILFNNNKWLFDPNIDVIINILPEQYFANCGVLIILISLVIAIAMLIIYEFIKRKTVNTHSFS